MRLWIVFALLVVTTIASAATDYTSSPTHSVILKARIKTIPIVANVTNFTNPASPSVTRYYKMNGTFVSESICQWYVGGCKNEIAPTVQTVVYHNQTGVVRTMEQCAVARQKDWDVFTWSNYPNVDPSTTGPGKENVLDNIAQGQYSNQYICLHGG